MKLKKILFAITVLSIWIICVGGCERDTKNRRITLTFQNNTTDTLEFTMQYNYPDTTLISYDGYNADPNAVITAKTVLVPPHSSGEYVMFTGWQNEIRRRNSYETLIVVVYSLDTIRKYPFTQIRDEYNIIKRYDLHIDDLEAMKWVVTYP